MFLFVSFGAYGHLGDKLEFIEKEFTRIFYDVFDVGGYAGSSRLCCFDATRLPLSNKLEFAQFGAHMQKLWQFWFPSSSTAGRSGSTAWVLQAVVPL